MMENAKFLTTPGLKTMLSRREALRIGGLIGTGLTSLPAIAANPNPRVGTFGKVKQVIILYLHGGHPQQETFDPKPDGPSEVKGEFGAIETMVPGHFVSELLPKCASILHKMAVIRSMSHGNANHVQASLPANTGHRHPDNVARGDFPPSDKDFPPFGAVVNAVAPRRAALPNWVRIGPLMRRSNGTVLHGQLPGFLGNTHASFDIDQPLLGEDVKVQAVEPVAGLSVPRLARRKQLRDEFESFRQLVESTSKTESLDTSYARAIDLLSSEKTQRAFDLSSETQAIRDRYGKTEFGQRCLLARRLAEAGVPITNVSYCHTPSGSWDTHSQNFKKMKTSLAPTLDAAVSALVQDLDERGRLEDTLVIVTAEFGRTPKINRNSGRDHWPHVYSLALAGAGIRSGTVYGVSDESAAYPKENPHVPEDFAATLYHLLGIPSDTMIYDKTQRPHRLVIGKLIDSILV